MLAFSKNRIYRTRILGEQEFWGVLYDDNYRQFIVT